uniref:DNA-directed RNA polymerase subunit n=1 Tax=Wickerhamiella domercqiae TaxID=45788 RepID=A0A0P0IQQ2_WICDO|nr:RNA polymerase III largest subunit [Wickerhamiella domercqiae]
MGKKLVEDNPPRYISGLRFGVLSPEEIRKFKVVDIVTTDLYNLDNGRQPAVGGSLDRRMGISDNASECDTCHGRLATCPGHFGRIKLALPVFHVGYFKQTITVLQEICKECGCILLEPETRKSFLADLRVPMDNLKRMQILKKINEQCKKQRRCPSPSCRALNGVVKKGGALKIVHDKFRWIGKKIPDDKADYDNSFSLVVSENPEYERLIKRAMDDLNPLRVYNLFSSVKPEDCELLGLLEGGRPENYLWTEVLAPPVCIRPSITQDTASNEDDLTVKLTEIVKASAQIQAGFDNGMALHELMNQWEFMQLSLALYINSDTPTGSVVSSSPIRALCQRLKGKQGRFRGNLSGKRVDFSGRTVISPDPNLRIDEVAVPERIAKILTYPERVTRYNRDKLKRLVANGVDQWPGANYVVKKNEPVRRNLRFAQRQELAKDLAIGDTVERHLEDGDIVLFNRQPSLHRLSILSHFVKVRPWRTLRLNECVCTPYNADFDGDEMNLHVPQTEEARAEARDLMGVKHNLVSPRSGAPIIAATQDFISASYLVTSKDQFFDRAQLSSILCMMSDANVHFDIPHPAIFKPQRLWTGKQVFSLLIKPNHESRVAINLEAKNKAGQRAPPGQEPEMSPNDGYVVIRGSEILSGVMDKSLLGDGNKNSVFYAILRDYGPDEAAAAMNRMAKMSARWLGNRGFSIGISDVTPSDSLTALKDRLVHEAYVESDALIRTYAEGKLETQPGCNEEETLEAKISGILSDVRGTVGDVCIRQSDKHNSPLIMALCGSKGSPVNVSQMVACVGQQIISGNRVADGFQDRTLPHFPKFSKTPPSKGFVSNSFYSGLSPPEFLFHAISGREGLVDTAVKTAETGYMSRRLMKSLEDLSTLYDRTVRTSSNLVVQFRYGGDGLDPFDMEGDAQPVDFKRTWSHTYERTFDDNEPGLTAEEALILANEIIPSPPEEADTYLEPQFEYYQSLRNFLDGKLDPVRTKPAGVVKKVYKVSADHIRLFIESCLTKYERAKVEPGTAVGAIGAHSIGEPGTQMTLKTFHFAGVASMNITLGVPRIKEIINASKVISTPIIKACLANDQDERTARIVKGRVEKTLLRDISEYMEDIYNPDGAYVLIKIDWSTVEKLQLELSLPQIAFAVSKHPKLKLSEADVRIRANDGLLEVAVRPVSTSTNEFASEKDYSDASQLYFRGQQLRRVLPEVVVEGYPDISRAVINIGDDDRKELLVEGYGLRDVMITDGIVGTRTTTNHILEMRQYLGIEAARASIIHEISYTMSTHGMSVDPRHIQLLGDVMTFKGEVLGITRFGLAKMRDSVLQLASFEKTTDHLFDAAFFMKTDKVEGVSECIITGQSVRIGTGAFSVVQPFSPEPMSKVPLIESAIAATAVA